MGLFEHFPYTNFHSLNIEWAIEKIKELLQQGETLYGQLQQWKTDTDTELAAWKTQTLSDLDTWKTALESAVSAWEEEAEGNYTVLENMVTGFINSYTAITKVIPTAWESGTITASGPSPNSAFIRSPNFINISALKPVQIHLNAGYSAYMYLYTYDEATDTYTYAASQNLAANAVYNGTYDYCKLRLYHGGTTMTPEEGTNAVLTSNKGLPVNVKHFGATGDGTTDDSAAFLAAMNAGREVYAPTASGEIYVIHSTIRVPDTCKRLYGDAAPSISPVSGGLLFTPQSASSIMFRLDDVELFTMSNLRVRCAGFNNTQAGVTFTNQDTDHADIDVSIESCCFSNFTRITSLKGRGVKFYNCSFAEIGADCFRLMYDATLDAQTSLPGKYQQRALVIKDCRFHVMHGTIVYVYSGNANGLVVDGNLCDMGSSSLLAAGSSNTLYNVRVTSNTHLGQTATAASINVPGGLRDSIIANNVFSRPSDYWNTQTSKPTKIINAPGSKGLIISNNAMHTATQYAVDANGWTGCVVQGNTARDCKAFIHLAGTSEKIIISGNAQSNETESNTVFMSAEDDATANNSVIYGNTYADTAGVDASTPIIANSTALRTDMV